MYVVTDPSQLTSSSQISSLPVSGSGISVSSYNGHIAVGTIGEGEN